MFNFLTPTFVLGIITYGIYRLFELFVCKKERIMLIEKLSENDLKFPKEGSLDLSILFHKSISFNALKIGLLLVGFGIGLFIGFIFNIFNYNLLSNDYELKSISYGAPLLLFGGIGLVIAFIIEAKMNAKKEDNK